MEESEYFALIRERLGRCFDIAEDGVWLGEKFDIAAKCVARETQTALFKGNVMDYLDSTEICLVSSAADAQAVESALAEIPALTEASASPSRHHKETILARVIVMRGADEKSTRLVKAFHFSKSFKFCLHGFCRGDALLVDLESGETIASRAARIHVKMFKPPAARP